ncbi:MAG: hypothetical protein AAFY65_04855 [Pseudomonadota bacterium]
MTDFTTVTADADRLEMLERRAEVAHRTLLKLCEDLDAKVDAVRAGPVEEFDRSALDRLIGDLRKGFFTAFETEGKVADAKRIERGGDGLDLAAAGAEVRRRLGRLRDAQSTERLLGGLE